MTNSPNENPDDSKRPSPTGSQTIDPTTNDSTSQRDTLTRESELVGRLLLLEAFPTATPERPAVAVGDAPRLFDLDGKPVTSVDQLSPKQPILSETINANGQREIVAYSNVASFKASKPTARLVLDTEQDETGSVERGTIFRGDTDEILSTRAIMQDASSFNLTFEVNANGETQRIVFDIGGLPTQFELVRDGRKLDFKFDDNGNVVDVEDSQNPGEPMREPFRTMFMLAAKQSLTDLRAAQGLPEPWMFGDELADGSVVSDTQAVSTDALSATQLYERSFTRGGLPAVLEDMDKMSPEQRKEVLKVAIEQLQNRRQSEALTDEQADSIAGLSRRALADFSYNSPEITGLFSGLTRLASPSLYEAFGRESKAHGNSEFMTLTMRLFVSEQRDVSEFSRILPDALSRFSEPADVGNILTYGKLNGLYKNHPELRETVSKWLEQQERSDNREVQTALLRFVSKNGLESFGISAGTDASQIQNRIVEKAFADLKSESPTDREAARDALARLVSEPTASRQIVPQLLKLLGNEESPPTNVEKDALLFIALHATETTQGAEQQGTRRDLLNALTPLLESREHLGTVMQGAMNLNRGWEASLKSLQALAALTSEFPGQAATITGAMVDAYSARRQEADKLSDDQRPNSNEREAQKDEFRKILESLGGAGIGTLQTLAQEQLKSSETSTALDALVVLSSSKNDDLRRRSSEAFPSIAKNLDTADLVRVLSNGDLNEEAVRELCKRAAENPEKKAEILRQLMDRCVSSTGSTAADSAFRTLGRIYADSPESDPSWSEVADKLLELAKGNSPDKHRAWNVLVSTALHPSEIEPQHSYACGQAILRSEHRLNELVTDINAIDVGTVDGVNRLSRLAAGPFKEQSLERLRNVFKANDPTAEHETPPNLELFRAAFDGLKENESGDFLRSLARSGESVPQVVERLKNHLSSYQLQQLRREFNVAISGADFSMAQKLQAAHCLIALGLTGLNSQEQDSAVRELPRVVDSLTRQQQIPSAERAKLLRAADSFMTSMVDSNRPEHQMEALSYFSERVRANADFHSQLTNRALTLLKNPETAYRAAELLIATGAKGGDAPSLEQIRSSLLEAALTNPDVLRQLVLRAERHSPDSREAGDLLVRLASQNKDLIPQIIEQFVSTSGRFDSTDRNVMNIVDRLAAIEPVKTIQAISEIRKERGGTEASVCLARLVTSGNSKVSDAAKTELEKLAQAEGNRREVFGAISQQYDLTGSDKLIPMLVGLAENKTQFKATAGEAIADLASRAKTSNDALNLLRVVGGVDSPAAREAITHLQQLALTSPEQMTRVYQSLADSFAGTPSPAQLNSPALSLHANLLKNRPNDPIVSGTALRQSLLELVDRYREWTANDDNTRSARYRVGNILGQIAGSRSMDSGTRIADFVLKFGPDAQQSLPPDVVPNDVTTSQPLSEPSSELNRRSGSKPELVGPPAPTPTEPFTRGDGTRVTPVIVEGIFKGTTEVAPDKTRIARDSDGRITSVVTPSGGRREFVWGPQGFVTTIRESGGLEFTSSDGINYRMRPPSGMSPILSGDLTIESNGAYSFKSSDETTLRRDVTGQITVTDGTGNLVTRINTDGSSVNYNEDGQVAETRSATGQIRKYRYQNECDEQPIEVEECGRDASTPGVVYRWQHDNVWTSGADGRTRTGEYTVQADGSLEFRRNDGVRIVEKIDGSHLEFDARNRMTRVQSADGQQRLLGYTGDGPEPTSITHMNRNGESAIWSRTNTAPPPDTDTWTREKPAGSWKGKITAQPDGSVILQAPGRAQEVLETSGWKTEIYDGKKTSTRTNPDGTTVTTNDAGVVIGITNGAGQGLNFSYDDDGRLKRYFDGRNTWSSSDGKNWQNSHGAWRNGLVQIDKSGEVRFTSDNSGTQITHNLDGSVITRNNRGLITEISYSNGRTTAFEYAPGGRTPMAMTTGEGRWTTTDGANWSLQGANPARTERFTLELDQVEGSLIQLKTATNERNVFLRNGASRTIDGNGRITYDELPNGTWTKTAYNAQGQRITLEERLATGVFHDKTFVQVDGKEQLERLKVKDLTGREREYTFDPSRKTPDGKQQLVTAFRDEQGWWRRQETGAGNTYKLEGRPAQNSPLNPRGSDIRNGEVRINAQGEFFQISQDQVTVVKNNGTVTIETQNPAKTSRTWDSQGRLFETIDYAGVRRRFEYNRNNEVIRFREFDGRATKVFEANEARDCWVARTPDGAWAKNSDGSSATRVGSYIIDQVTGQMTLTFRDSTNISFLTRQPASVDKDMLYTTAGKIKEQLDSWGGDTNKMNDILQLIRSLTWEEKNELYIQYAKRYGGEGLNGALKSIREDARLQITNELNRRNDDVNYAGQIQAVLREIKNGGLFSGTRSEHTCVTEIRELLWQLNTEKLQQLDSEFRKRNNGKPLRDAILEQVTSEPDRTAMLLVLDRNQANGQVDYQKMVDLAIEHRRVDLLRETLAYSPQTFRDRFLNDGGEQKIKDRFEAKFWDYVFSYSTLGIRDMYLESQGIGIGSSREVRGLTDHAYYGTLSEGTVVSDNTSWLGDNEEAIELSLNSMSQDRRRLYGIGLALASGTQEADLEKLFPHLALMTPDAKSASINLARRFYADLDAALTKAAGFGTDTKVVELAKWRDLILHPSAAGSDRPPGSIVTRLAPHMGYIYNSSKQEVVTTIENMSKEDWEYISKLPEDQRKRVLEEVGSILQLIKPEIKEECMRLLNEKFSVKTWEEAKTLGRRDVVTALDHIKHGAFYNPQPLMDALQNMPKAERDKVKNDEVYRTNLRNELVKVLSLGDKSKAAAEALVDSVLERIAAGGSPQFTPLDFARLGALDRAQAADEPSDSEGASHRSPDSVKYAQQVIASLMDPDVRAQYQQNAALRDQLRAELQKMFPNGDQFVHPLMRMIDSGGLEPDAFKLFVGDNFSRMLDNLPRITPAARENLLKNDAAFQSAFGNLDWQKQSVIRSILENGGQPKPEDYARAFVLKWGVDRGTIVSKFQGLDSPARDAACREYHRKYGSLLDADFRKELGSLMSQNLLSRNETAEMQVQRLLSQYYSSNDGIGSVLVQKLWDGTPAQARAAADRLIQMHAEANREFKLLKDNPEFKQAVKGLNDAIQEYVNSKGATAEALTTAVLTIVGLALALPSGGTSLSLIVLAATIGAAAKVGINMMVMGADYDSRERALTDILTGGLESALNLLGPGHVAKLLGMTAKVAETVGAQVVQKAGKQLFKEGAEAFIQAELKRELGQAVASGSSHVSEEVLKKIASQSLNAGEHSAANVERVMLMLKNEIKTAMQEQTKLTVQNLLKEMGINALTGSGSAFLSTAGGVLISSTTGHGPGWDPHLSFEKNMEMFMMQAGTSALIGGGVGSAFHAGIRSMGAAKTALRSRRTVEIDGLETLFHGPQTTPEAKAGAIDKMIDWAKRAPAKESEKAFERIRQTLGVDQEVWNSVVKPLVGKSGVTGDELNKAISVAQRANVLDHTSMQTVLSLPEAKRIHVLEALLDGSGDTLHRFKKLPAEEQSIIAKVLSQVEGAADRSQLLTEWTDAIADAPRTAVALRALSSEVEAGRISIEEARQLFKIGVRSDLEPEVSAEFFEMYGRLPQQSRGDALEKMRTGRPTEQPQPARAEETTPARARDEAPAREGEPRKTTDEVQERPVTGRPSDAQLQTVDPVRIREVTEQLAEIQNRPPIGREQFTGLLDKVPAADKALGKELLEQSIPNLHRKALDAQLDKLQQQISELHAKGVRKITVVATEENSSGAALAYLLRTNTSMEVEIKVLSAHTMRDGISPSHPVLMLDDVSSLSGAQADFLRKLPKIYASDLNGFNSGLNVWELGVAQMIGNTEFMQHRIADLVGQAKRVRAANPELTNEQAIRQVLREPLDKAAKDFPNMEILRPGLPARTKRTTNRNPDSIYDEAISRPVYDPSKNQFSKVSETDIQNMLDNYRKPPPEGGKTGEKLTDAEKLAAAIVLRDTLKINTYETMLKEMQNLNRRIQGALPPGKTMDDVIILTRMEENGSSNLIHHLYGRTAGLRSENFVSAAEFQGNPTKFKDKVVVYLDDYSFTGRQPEKLLTKALAEGAGTTTAPLSEAIKKSGAPVIIAHLGGYLPEQKLQSVFDFDAKFVYSHDGVLPQIFDSPALQKLGFTAEELNNIVGRPGYLTKDAERNVDIAMLHPFRSHPTNNRSIVKDFANRVLKEQGVKPTRAQSRQPKSVTQVSENLYRSGAAKSPEEFSKMVDETGANIVVDLRGGPGGRDELQSVTAQADWASKLPGKQVEVRNLGIPTEWPMRGTQGYDQLLDNLAEFERIVAQANRDGKKVLFHCYHGEDRTGLVNAFHDVVSGNKSIDEAMSTWQKKGTENHPGFHVLYKRQEFEQLIADYRAKVAAPR